MDIQSRIFENFMTGKCNIPHQLQSLTATIALVALLSHVQVSLSDWPHSSTFHEASIFQNLKLPEHAGYCHFKSQ